MFSSRDNARNLTRHFSKDHNMKVKKIEFISLLTEVAEKKSKYHHGYFSLHPCNPLIKGYLCIQCGHLSDAMAPHTPRVDPHPQVRSNDDLLSHSTEDQIDRQHTAKKSNKHDGEWIEASSVELIC